MENFRENTKYLQEQKAAKRSMLSAIADEIGSSHKEVKQRLESYKGIDGNDDDSLASRFEDVMEIEADIEAITMSTKRLRNEMEGREEKKQK